LQSLLISALKRLASAVQLRPWPPHFSGLSPNVPISTLSHEHGELSVRIEEPDLLTNSEFNKERKQLQKQLADKERKQLQKQLADVVKAS
jgi:hypothetical protein